MCTERSLIFCILLILLNTVESLKITLFDSTKLKEDLNWSKLSYRESELVAGESESRTEPDWLQDKLSNIDTKNSLYGWKESSYSMQGVGNDVWRIHFVCDLNEQNIQNWLFMPPINTREANRLTLNLTFTIRECNKFPIKQVVKNCREKFELYYEEIQEANYAEESGAKSSEFFLNKIKQLRFRDTFVSDTGLRYYNSVVDRKRNHYLSSPGDSSSINVELREIPLAANSASNGYIRFAIRDTGACISLLSVEASYVTCSEMSKFGIVFPETSTGRDLTDLIQVSGKCPTNSASTQTPKAICTAKGEWLITDQNLADRCLCQPGFEFVSNECLPCQIGYYKAMSSNDLKCIRCPANSWSSRQGASKCECQDNYYRDSEQTYAHACQPTQLINMQHLGFHFIGHERLNISLNRESLSVSSRVIIEIKCAACVRVNRTSRSSTATHTTEVCVSSCMQTSKSNDWLVIDTAERHLNASATRHQKYELSIMQHLNENQLASSLVYLNLNQVNRRPETTNKGISCEMFQDSVFEEGASLCSNVSLNLTAELQFAYDQFELPDRLRSKHSRAELNVYAQFKNKNKYRLVPGDFKVNAVKSSFVHMRKMDSAELRQLMSAQNSSLASFLVCNLADIEFIRIELSVRPTSTAPTSLDMFVIDFSLHDHCPRINEILDKNLLMPSTKMYLKELKNYGMLEASAVEDDSQNSSIKVHVILPIVLSFFMVGMIIFVAVFFRRFQFGNLKERELTCDKHIRRFMPMLNNKSSSTKCINCSSSSSSNSSSSSSTTSTSPSTTCTTSQILEHTASKLYYVDPHNYEDPAIAIQEFAQEIAPLDIKIESVIGGGEFGDVCKGKLKSASSSSWITVAIKTLKCGSSEKNRCDFLTEASIMAQFHHENIICLEGVVTQTHPYMIITEYMENGSLDTFLRLNSWRLDIHDLVKMLKDIANGMKYLAGMNFVHRDLAARNILVNKDLKCKVADFGLSREIDGGNTTEGVYWTKGGKIPVRWTAPEAISHTKFTCSSDVWSFGVVAWEVMSFGERPYWNWSNTDVIKAIDKGFRLFIPTNCPQIIYDMMLECWQVDRLKRPKFKQIVNDLDCLIKTKKECLFIPTKSIKNVPYVDTNRPNFAQLTSVKEWLNSLDLIQYSSLFQLKGFYNLSQVLGFDRADLSQLDVWDENDQATILESLKCIHFELNFQNGFLV